MSTLTEAEYADLKSQLFHELGSQFAPNTVLSDVDVLSGWKRKLDSDGSFGRIQSGPQWIANVSMRDGNISGNKLSANLVISSLFQTVDVSVSPTADRMELDTTSLRFYGTVSAVANTKTAEFKATGDFTLGTTNPITYVASTGVLTVPAAVIGSLTIANVGAGIIGGLYKTSASNAHLELDTAGIRMYDASAVKTFDATASTGALALTGNLTVGTGGKVLFGASAADYLSDNILHFELGTSEQARIEWKNGANTPRGVFTGYAGSAVSGAIINANYDGSYNGAGQLTVAPNHYATAGASTSATNGAASLYGSYAGTAASTATVNATGGSTVATTFAYMRGGSYGQIYIDTDATSSYGRLQVQGRLYPGTDTGAQTARYIVDDGTSISIFGGLWIGSGLLRMGNTGIGTGTMPSATKWWQVSDAGNLRYIPLYTAPNNWAA